MNTINDGGPAFPLTYSDDYSGDAHNGMTLRDYFAAKALHVGMSGSTWADVRDGADEVAVMAYTVADAMLKARGE